VSAGFQRRDARLLCDGVALTDLAERAGTPLYVYSRAAIEERFRTYDRALAAVPHRVCYALKANGCGALLRVLAGLGAGADVVSGFELRAALRAGFPADRVVFAGVGKTEDELALGLKSEIAEFNAESEEEIRRLGTLAVRLGRVARVALRVNPDIDPRSHPYISTGLRENKFGVDIALAGDVLRRARGTRGVEVVGLQCHLGSQIVDLGPLEESARELAALSRRLLDEGFALRTVNLGGGLGVDYDGGGVPGPEAFAARVLPALAGLPLTVLIEPGRSIVGPAGVLLTRVLYRKEQGGKRFLIVDAAMNDLLRPSLYGAYHRIEPVVERGRPLETVDVVGPVCETGDFLARGRELPAAEAGELLAVGDAGAYGFCMSSNYNMRPRAAEVLVEAGVARLVRRRETFEDLVDTEVVGEG
jgi:diaminopimelate decarboxylase